jgi:prepilin peptidase CpaA
MIEVLSSVALCATALAAALHDVRTRRIPNGIAFAGVLAALALRLAAGPDAALEGLLGALIGLAVGFALFALGVFGGGDGKFLMAVGAFLGHRQLLGAMVVIALVGGVLALFEAARRGVLGAALKRTGWTMLHLGTLGRLGWRPRGAPVGGASAEAFSVPYGVAIAAGAVITWFFGVSL